MAKLRIMTADEFQTYLQQGMRSYAAEKVRAEKISLSKATTLAQNEYQTLLPNGLETEKNYFYMVEEDGQVKGYIWLAAYRGNDEIAFVYDINIYPDFQNQGLGTQTLELATEKMKQYGYKYLRLHVFGHNKRAIHVYEKLGLHATDIVMEKEI